MVYKCALHKLGITKTLQINYITTIFTIQYECLSFFVINAIINYNRYNIGGFIMAKNKIDDIEAQIEKLKKKKADLIAKIEKEVGAYLIKSWGAI